MNSRTRTGLIIAAFGFILILLGIYAAITLLNIDLMGELVKTQPTPVPETKVTIAFAVNDIAPGKVILQEDVALSGIPVQYAPRDTIANLDAVVGKMSKVEIFAGEMILDHNLANPTGQVFDIAYILDEKHVLMALPATDLMSREALIKRGDIIDILVSYEEILQPVSEEPTTAEEKQVKQQQVTFTAFQRLDISALVVDIITSDNADRQQEAQALANPGREQVIVQTYLVALDPQDALVLKYLKDIGGIFDYVLRAPTSTGQFMLTPVTSEFIKELYGLELLP